MTILARFLFLPLLNCLGMFPAIAAHRVLLLADHPVDKALTQETLTANMLDSLERHSSGELVFAPQIVPQNRSWMMLDQNTACLLNQIKTPEREAKAIYTGFPMTLYPPLRLIVPASQIANLPKEFDPGAFNLAQGDLIGLVKGRSYGANLDKMFAQGGDHYFIRGGTEPAERLVDMLAAKRIQGLIDYSRSVHIYLDEIQSPFAFSAIPVLNEETPVAGYIACSRTPLGQTIVDTLNAIYASDAMLEDFLKFHRAFFGNEETALLEPEIRAYHDALKARINPRIGYQVNH